MDCNDVICDMYPAVYFSVNADCKFYACARLFDDNNDPVQTSFARQLVENCLVGKYGGCTSYHLMEDGIYAVVVFADHNGEWFVDLNMKNALEIVNDVKAFFYSEVDRLWKFAEEAKVYLKIQEKALAG